jgi:uncharacterized protein (DUF1800 family)
MRTALLAELDQPQALLIGGSQFPLGASILDNARTRSRTEQASGQPMPRKDPRFREIFLTEVAERMRRAKQAEIGFGERLVAFWANHFCIGKRQARLYPIACSLEREAIRPHVFGRFSEMLLAATRHPAMQLYLDNYRSVGPNSAAGLRLKRGINENHAREILELHTVGVEGRHYTQDDVVAFALALTGWGIALPSMGVGDADGFQYRPAAHEPGARKVMGKTYREGGVEQGEAILANLARHPATARHISFKLARAFVADEPPPALVEALARSFRETDGNLKELAATLVRSEEAWSAGLRKFKPPQDYLWSSLRALDLDLPPAQVVAFLADLGQRPWSAPSPAGYSDLAADWLSPDALTNRVDLTERLVQRDRGRSDPRELTAALLGPGVSDETSTAIRRAASREQALTLLLMSPEMQRR